MTKTPTIAIVGRPNVGKSTLFNRLIGERRAVVAKEAGTTRDRISKKFEFEGHETMLVDTGGLEHGKQENIEENIQIQAKMAIEDADIILFIVDIAKDPTVDDYAAAEILRKSKKPVIFIANKADTQKAEDLTHEFYELGFDKPIAISAIHNRGLEDLKKEVAKNLKKIGAPSKKEKQEDDEKIEICILGKPNAGKSSLVNALFGTEKVIVSDIPGTTRDSTDTEIEYDDKKFTLIDTAGLKRPGKIKVGIEKFSALRALQSVERSDIVVLLIDGEVGITSGDMHIAQHALEQEKGLIIAINKIDTFEDKEEKESRFISQIKRRFSFTPWAPLIFISAKHNKNTKKILELSHEIMKERRKRIPTGELNAFLQKITYKHLPASAKLKKPRFMYGSQVDICPPKFALFFKNYKNLHFSYPRYLENEIRKEYGFNGTSINISLRQGQAEDRKKKKK